MTRIGAPANHKTNMYKNEVRRKKKVGGGGRQQDLVRRKMNFWSSVKPFYLKRWSNWIKSLIKTEICDQYELTMMVSHVCHLLVDVLLWLSSVIIETVSTVVFPSSVSLSTTFLNHSLM
jgi:hypothetical protein